MRPTSRALDGMDPEEPAPPSQARILTEQLREWAESAGFRIAPPKTFLPASTVVAAARRATGIVSDHTDEYFAAALLRVMHEVRRALWRTVATQQV